MNQAMIMRYRKYLKERAGTAAAAAAAAAVHRAERRSVPVLVRLLVGVGVGTRHLRQHVAASTRNGDEPTLAVMSYLPFLPLLLRVLAVLCVHRHREAPAAALDRRVAVQARAAPATSAGSAVVVAAAVGHVVNVP